MRKVLLIATSLLILSPNLFAQQDPNDPGIQDSIIIESAYVDSGDVSRFLPVYVVADEDIYSYHLPVVWDSHDNNIYAHSIFYAGDLVNWSFCFDTIWTSQSFIRMFGRGFHGRDSLFLNTHGQRMRCWAIRFRIMPNAQPQEVLVNILADSRSEHVKFGLRNGGIEIIPAVVQGHLYYGQITGINNEDSKPDQFYLSQNYPNPFNASTEIIFDLPSAQNVNLSIYNLLGQQVAVLVDDFKQPGRYSVNWNGTDNPSGVYFYRLETSGNVQTRKMIMMK